LLEIQKAPKAAKDQEGDQQNLEEIVINFQNEPNKSKKQLAKLVAVVSDFVMKRAEFFSVVKQNAGASGDFIIVDEDDKKSYLSRMLANGAKVEESEAEEKAYILALVFGKITSVVFDARSICELFSKEGQTESGKELLANLLFIQLALTKQNAGLTHTSRHVFQKYWELSQSVLSLTKLNEMI